MRAITLTLVALIAAESRRDIALRFARFATMGVPAAIATAWLWLPFLSQTAYAGVSPYLQREKYDSYGAGTILGWLASGDLFDHGRLPVITFMVGVGIVTAVLVRTTLARTVLALFAVWLVLYFGRPTLGDLVALLPMQDSLLIHRFIGSVEIFAIALIGIGAAGVADGVAAITPPPRFAMATPAAPVAIVGVAALALLAPAMAER